MSGFIGCKTGIDPLGGASISAFFERENLQLLIVVLGAKTLDVCNKEVAKILVWVINRLNSMCDRF